MILDYNEVGLYTKMPGDSRELVKLNKVAFCTVFAASLEAL